MQVRQSLEAYLNQPPRIDEVGVRARKGQSTFSFDEPKGETPKNGKPEGVGRAVQVQLSLAGRIRCVVQNYNPATLGRPEAVMLTEELVRLGLDRRDVRDLLNPLVESYDLRTQLLRDALRDTSGLAADSEASAAMATAVAANAERTKDEPRDKTSDDDASASKTTTPSVSSWTALGRHFERQAQEMAQEGKKADKTRRLATLAKLFQ